MERSVIAHFFIILFLILTSGCSNAQTEKTGIKVINAQEFKEKLDATEEGYLIDVRTPNEFKSGAIKGSINYNILDGTFSSKIKGLDKTKAIFVYCAKGGRSNNAAKMLLKEGFSEIYDLKGGYGDWPFKVNTD